MTVLLVGVAQPSAHAAARSLRRAGFDVLGACESGRLAGRSRYLRKRLHIPSSTQTAEFLAEVRGICAQEGVDAVLPLADEMMGALLADRSAHEPWKLVGPSWNVFESVCDKARLVETAEAAGVSSPSSVLVSPEGPMPALPRLPAFVKVVSGAAVGRPAGRPARVQSVEECEAAVSALVADGLSAIVQEEIVGEGWRFHFARSSGRTSHVSARTCADFPRSVGQSTVSAFGATPPALEVAATTLLDSLGYEGVGSVQFVLRDRTWYVHDVNLRLPASVGGTVAAGLDMPRLAIEIALGRSLPLDVVRARSMRFVQLHGELAALRTALAGKRAGRSPAAIAWGIGLAAVLPGRMLEPLDVRDPLSTAAALASARGQTRPTRAQPSQPRTDAGP